MNISLYNLSKNQITILKGLGMIVIVLHNFIHWTNPIRENEFQFDPARIFTFYLAIKNEFLMIINGTISYFGIFALQIFIFASAYGLSKQFMAKKPASYWKYIAPRLIKIYALIGFGLICYFLLLYPIGALTFKKFLNFAFSSVFLLNNFSYDTIFHYPYIGPWWYFILIIQLYLLFPLLYSIIDKYKKKGFFISLLISYILIYVLYPVTESHNIPLFGNFIGHLPEFIFGIGMAMFKEFRLDLKVIIIILVLFILSSFHAVFFPLSFLCATILILFFCYPIYNSSSPIIQKPLLFIGGISMFMFILNGPLRAYLIGYAAYKPALEALGWGMLQLCITIILSYFASLIYKKTVSPLQDKLINAVRR